MKTTVQKKSGFVQLVCGQVCFLQSPLRGLLMKYAAASCVSSPHRTLQRVLARGETCNSKQFHVVHLWAQWFRAEQKVFSSTGHSSPPWGVHSWPCTPFFPVQCWNLLHSLFLPGFQFLCWKSLNTNTQHFRLNNNQLPNHMFNTDLPSLKYFDCILFVSSDT